MKRWLAIICMGLLAPAIVRAADLSDSLKIPAPALHTLQPEPYHPVSLADFRGAVAIVMFWRDDCMPCRVELQALPRLAITNPHTPFILLSLRDDAKARTALTAAALPENVHAVMGEEDGQILLQQFGDPRRALPFSLSLHKDGTICARHHGLLGADKIQEWSRTC